MDEREERRHRLREGLRRKKGERLRDQLRQPHFWLPDDVHSLDTILQDIGRTLGPRPIVLFTVDDSYTGAIRLPANRVFMNSARMRELGGGHLDLIAEDLQHGLGVGFTSHDANDEFVSGGIYQVTSWGDFDVKIR